MYQNDKFAKTSRRGQKIFRRLKILPFSENSRQCASDELLHAWRTQRSSENEYHEHGYVFIDFRVSPVLAFS